MDPLEEHLAEARFEEDLDMSLTGWHECRCGRQCGPRVLPSKCCGLEGEFGSESIVFCPLHETAKDMLEFLKLLKPFMGYEPKASIYTRVCDLIDRAEGRK